jgi:hypothetical protein
MGFGSFRMVGRKAQLVELGVLTAIERENRACLDFPSLDEMVLD